MAIPMLSTPRGLVPNRVAIRDALARLERSMFSNPADAPRVQEILALARSQEADDRRTNSPARFGGKRTVSLGDTDEPVIRPSRLEREEQEALEVGMQPDLNRLSDEDRSALNVIYRYRLSYRDGARRLGISTPALQRWVRRALTRLWRLGFRHGHMATPPPDHTCPIHVKEADNVGQR